MKKRIFISLIASIFLMTGVAFAGLNSSGDSGSAIGFGGYNIGTFDIGGGYMMDGKSIDNGFAGGIGAGGGIAGTDAQGLILNGSVEGEVTSVAGGFGRTNVYRLSKYDVFDCGSAPDKFIGVGSRSDAYAITGASFKIKVDPAGEFPTAGGGTTASMFGVAGQGTLNVSGVGSSPLEDWKTEGFSGGIAAQGSVGGFVGGGYAISGPDCRCHCWRVDSKAGASADAEIEMSGYSISESYRFMNDDGAYHTEGMGTRVAAGTDVTSYGYDHDRDNGLATSDSCLKGGFIAAGGVAAKTVQVLPGSGLATAHAVGMYAGAGTLGGNFSGSANGYTNTSITTLSGMNGSISSSSAGMYVSTVGTSGHSD